MTFRFLIVLAATFFAFAPGCAAAGPATAPAAGGLRVMSFNIRYGTAKDGEDHWTKRKEMVAAAIKAYDPDLLGTQEVLAEQADYLKEQLPGYTFLGGGRDDGKLKGEFSPIMFRTDRFEMVESGQRWLSPTPDVVGSKGWDAQLPRVLTWARLKDKKAGVSFLYINTHWDHVGKEARPESAKLMRRMLDERRAADPDLALIITGDFNSTEVTPAYQVLTTGAVAGATTAPAAAWRLFDSYREARPERKPDEQSAHGFKGTRTGMRIDWILHTAHWKATAAEIVYTNKDGRYPSDHYPVTADLVLTK